jgi:hypothetical protein
MLFNHQRRTRTPNNIKENKMGRPLKIAKANVSTITDTVAATDVVTVLSTLNFDKNQRFVAASNVGGIVGGTTYYIKEVLSLTTLTLSATPGGAIFDLTANTTGQTVKCSVGIVDAGFNNPDQASYGIVGGNTGIYGNQILANVCIAAAGPGTISSVAANTKVFGTAVGTDFANSAPVASAIEVAGVGALGFVASVAAAVAVSATVATGNLVTVASSAGFVLNKPVVFNAAISVLAANTLYYVKSKPDGGNISVSTTPGGANVALTDVTAVSSALQDVITLAAPSAFSVTDAAWTHASAEAGFILRQKGRSKFLVQGTSGLIGQCTLTDAANAALTGGQMNVVATTSAPADFFVDRIADHQVHGFGANTDVQTQYVATFGTAYAADTYGGQPDAIVTIAKA